MLQNDHNLCLIHKAREEFICVNSICMDKQKKLSCYKCLEALHIYHHNPNEDFKSIYAIIEQITLEKEERLIILENAKQWNLDQKKKKRQELEKSEIFSTQYKNKLQSQIDQQFDQSCKKINEIQKCLEEANPYHPFFFSKLISLYKQNIEEFTEQIDKIKIKTLGNNLLLEQNSYIDLIECVKKLQEKNQILENKVDQLSIQKSFQKGRNNFYSVVFLSLFTIFIVQSFYNPFSDYEKKIDLKISSIQLNYQEILKSQNEQINLLKTNLLHFIDQEIQNFSIQILQLNASLKQQEKKNDDLGEYIFNLQLSFQEYQKNFSQLIKNEIDQNNKIVQEELNSYFENNISKNDLFNKFENFFESKLKIFHQFMRDIQSKIQQIDEKQMEMEKNFNFIQEFIESKKNHHKWFKNMQFTGFRNSQIFKHF